MRTLTGEQILSFWSRLARQRANSPNALQAANSNRNPLIRTIRETENEAIIDDSENEAYIEICDVEPADLDILEVDTEFYLLEHLNNTDCFEL